ncbi:autotransporter domain-containing protein [Bradyrhizobium quebecense]|uniref:Autotransporter domain-containing protein n=1 Tax=Bradyrhizobium quebecense TaxID=2748629 RepID=A0A973WL30_9BRAD|nr:autotransporter outer membrane beta-barrel domain-containing protein [Bradyrhizobium quebecense]UGA47613.1 autotransporter domain-containing protein [Bradyrhizobium quebecense]
MKVRGGVALLIYLCLHAPPAVAVDSTWTGGNSSDWNTASNWSNATVPSGTASFDGNVLTTITFSSAVTTIGTIQFNSAATDYTFAIDNPTGRTVVLNGLGIVGSSGGPTINLAGAFFSSLVFANGSGAGNAILNNRGFLGGIQFVNYSSAQNAVITNNFANLSFRNSSTAANASIFNYNIGSGAGTTFSDTSTAANANILNSGGTALTIFRDQSTAGKATIDNENCGETQFFNSSTASNARIIVGSCGGVTFSNTSTAANAVIANKFVATFGQTATAGNAVITTTNGGLTAFYDSSTAGNATLVTLDASRTAFLGNSNGALARFITNGSGVVDFSLSSGPNNDFKMTAGSIEGAGRYLLGANQLTVGGNNISTEVSGTISDCGPGGHDCGAAGTLLPFTSGSLVKIGTGTMLLSGINTYTGGTTVNGGFLDVMGSIASSSGTTVNSGGALTGSGIVSATTIAAGGIFLPGSGFGTSTSVQGNLAFQSGALYLVQLNSATSTFADVTGKANVSGNVSITINANGIVMKNYMILHAAGGVSGTFDGASAPGALVPTVTYDPTHAYIDFSLNFSAQSNLKLNQTNVADALANFFNSNGGIPTVFATLQPAGLSQASGELATGTQQATFNAMNMFQGVLIDPFITGRSDPVSGAGNANAYADENLAYAAKRKPDDALAAIYTKAPPTASIFEQRWKVWAAGYGGSQRTDGNAVTGSNDTRSSIYGTVVGVDYRISPDTIAGFALGGGGTNFNVNGLGAGRSDLFQAGAFVRHNAGPAYLTGALAYGWQDITTDRTVTVAGIDQLRAQFNASAWSGRIEGGYRFVSQGFGWIPYAAGQFTTFDLPNYAERAIIGANTFVLAYNGKSVTDTRSELGLRTDKAFAAADGILTLRGRVAWAHDFNPDRSIAAVFQTLPGASFVVSGARQASDSALVTAAAEKTWLNGWSAAATFEGEFSNVTESYAGKGMVRYAW